MGIWHWVSYWGIYQAFQMKVGLMFILQTIVTYLLKPQGRSYYFITQILGYLLLCVGGIIGLYFLFQALIPVIGYIGSGTAMSVLLMGAGVIVLIMGKRKKYSRPIDTIFGEAQSMTKKIDLENILKNNAHQILLFSFLGGLILSQVKEGKKLSFLKDKLPSLKDFLK